MPKRVNDQEGGTPVALEKKMRGTGGMGSGEIASGEMATRSVTRALSYKGSQDPLSSSESDQLLQKGKEKSKTFPKGVKRLWSTFTEDPYDGTEDPNDICVQVLKKWFTEERLEETKAEFDKWAAQHGRNYGSKEEREKRLLAYSENKRRIDASNKVNSPCKGGSCVTMSLNLLQMNSLWVVITYLGR